ncbi:Cytochrome b561, putative [Pediculus humanus corporis]|uniref:Cytochrome b561, putative n=1 Tax=Pediculus humanus subsp. corporis TaxID=121224 RepID=E0VKQ7_PEDHC|nr:Cytochrome b561, putative [Pediculus humanus corporis]EEB13963.1 Cytochrome b561, putative [Pediculus humanus corporis]
MENKPLEGFTFLFGLAEALGALGLILTAIWLGSYRGGFTWTSNPKLEFNWHPLLMMMGMIFLYANGILVYRSFRNSRKRKLKIAHAFINAMAFIFTIIGLQAVFDSHNLASPSPIPNMYSLHSWLGLASVILFALQWVFGLLSFLYPTLSAPLRATYYPIHVFFGINAFVCASASALLGLTEKAIFNVSDYSQFSSEGLLVNCIGVTIVIFTSLVVHLVTEVKFKRHPLPEDEMLLTSNE